MNRRAFVKVAGVVAWCTAFVKPRPARPKMSPDGTPDGTLYVSQDVSRGVVVPPGYDRSDMAERFSKRWSVTRDNVHWTWRDRFVRARKAYVVIVNRPLNLRTLVGLASKRSKPNKNWRPNTKSFEEVERW